MPLQPPLPPLITPYVSSQPENSLTLISSILGATSNWLVLRFLHAALRQESNNASLGFDEPHGSKRPVVLVSFLRGWEFWKAEAKRLGIDLGRLTDKKEFAFVDGLSELFSGPQPASVSTPPAVNIGQVRTTLPLRSAGAVPGRSPIPTQPTDRSNVPKQTQTGPGIAKKLHFTGRGVAALDALEHDIINVIMGLNGEKALLIIDQPDLLLAATGESLDIGATEMTEWIKGLQEKVYATVMTLAADSPLVHNASASRMQVASPIESGHAAFAIALAHRARSVMQLRTLETGAARDVSGVLRISRGGGWTEENLDEKELLYYIQRDGGVKVFGRGES
ncbi:hypothetical protein N7495_009663 [Penicillium taxi]|uniref:uncharacterized protein n=1 Tax=Penicillium taxi TaxID=168475 RepID=UPI002544F7C3|nr:uncharacterized protein N7495_009663 [Penicillium taxi]KAJ5885153.1 hypothetical protein N7495_009663 [Penicillium taxi]